MNWRTYFLLIVSILGVATLSCNRAETGAFNLKTVVESDTSNHGRESRRDKTGHEMKLITLVGLFDSFL